MRQMIVLAAASVFGLGGCQSTGLSGGPANTGLTTYEIEYDEYPYGGAGRVMTVQYDPVRDAFITYRLDRATAKWERDAVLARTSAGNYLWQEEDCSSQCETYSTYLYNVTFHPDIDLIAGLAGGGVTDTGNGLGPFVVGANTPRTDVNAVTGQARFTGDALIKIMGDGPWKTAAGDAVLTLDFAALGQSACVTCTGSIVIPAGQFDTPKGNPNPTLNIPVDQVVLNADGLTARMVIAPDDLDLETLDDIPVKAGYFGGGVAVIAGTFAQTGTYEKDVSYSTTPEIYDYTVMGYFVADRE